MKNPYFSKRERILRCAQNDNFRQAQLSELSIRETFDRIAPGWYGFRHRSIFTRELQELASRWKMGRLLNLGCAHGPDFVPFKESFELHGIDLSFEMLKLARKYSAKFSFYAHLLQGDVTCLPYRDSGFDFAISVATYHHLNTQEKRLKALRELNRVLRPGGEAFITVWNRWQPRFWLSGKEVAVPWRSRNGTLYRYYYLFTYGEIQRLVKEAGMTVMEAFPERGFRWPFKNFSRNICLLIKKKIGQTH